MAIVSKIKERQMTTREEALQDLVDGVDELVRSLLDGDDDKARVHDKEDVEEKLAIWAEEAVEGGVLSDSVDTAVGAFDAPLSDVECWLRMARDEGEADLVEGKSIAEALDLALAGLKAV